jgi:hypothetical protein
MAQREGRTILTCRSRDDLLRPKPSTPQMSPRTPGPRSREDNRLMRTKRNAWPSLGQPLLESRLNAVPVGFDESVFVGSILLMLLPAPFVGVGVVCLAVAEVACHLVIVPFRCRELLEPR